MDDEEAIYRDFQWHNLASIDAIERLQKLGYQPKDAEEVVSEWQDALEWSALTSAK